MKSTFGHIVIAVSLILLTSPIHSMETAKRWFNQASYHLMPASGNPITWFNNNFYTVQEGACYRSKTLAPAVLEKVINEKHIKTILNLREDHGYWFELEKAVAQKLGVALKTVTLDGKQLPTQKQLQEIFELFNKSAQPILIHCQAGADRTGLAAAFWKLTQENASLADALAQQVPSKGHFEWRYPFMRKCTQILKGIKEDREKNKLLNAWSDVLIEYAQKETELKKTLPSMPVRAVTSLYQTTVNAVKEHPKIAFATAAISAAAAGLIYAHKKGKLKPALKALKEKLS
jgi:protein tyrosine phosphatase (PTP) superfamily phosphohydrolase (DUF442 family)